MTELGKYIRQRRRALDLTQKELGERLERTGSKRSEFAISNWETGRQIPPIDIIPALARALEEQSIVKMLDLAGILDNLPEPDLIRLLETVSPVERKKIANMIKSYLTDESN